MRTAIAYIDGSGNSDRIQACACVLTVDGVCHQRTMLLPVRTTNNVGEYSGLLLALDLARELGVEALHVRSDSKLIVNQVIGKWKCKDQVLRGFRDQARRTAKEFDFRIEWVPRKDNAQADALCREVIRAALDSKSNPFFRARSHSPFVAIM